MWQEIEEASRRFESERALTATCIYAIFDAIIRTPATDRPLGLTESLIEDGGRALSLEISIEGGVRQALDDAVSTLELRTPRLARACSAACT